VPELKSFTLFYFCRDTRVARVPKEAQDHKDYLERTGRTERGELMEHLYVLHYSSIVC
jgi:hypothetical protein